MWGLKIILKKENYKLKFIKYKKQFLEQKEKIFLKSLSHYS